MKNFLSLHNLELKPSVSIKSFITASSEIIDYPIINILQENKNIWLSEEFLPQEIIINFRNVELKEYPTKLAAIGVYCMNKYPTNPKIIEVLISQKKGNNFISLGHFDLSFKAGRQLIYLYDDNDVELEEILNNINFDNLIIKLIIKETFGGKQTYINNLYLYDNIDSNNINNPNSNINYNSNINDNNINEYMNFDENMNINNGINNDINNDINDDINNDIDNDINLNDINDINDIEYTKNKNQYFNINKINNNIGINNEKSHEIINGNEIGYFDKNISSKIEEDNISDYKSRTIIGKYNKNNIISKRKREVKTPKIFKKNINQEDRPKTANSLHNRSINTTIKHYHKKNLLDYSNNNSLLTNNQFNNLHINPSNKLNQLINEFRNYKENQELIMNNYETRVKLLEERCKELKNTIKQMNTTMNTLIESQYNQSQASNDYFLKECQNMINEAIINAITHIGRNMESPPVPMYQNYPYNLKENKNMNKINMNYNNIHTNRKNNNNNYIYEEFGQKEMNYNNNINNYYDDIDYNYMMYNNDNDNNENDDNNYMNNMNNNINDNQENYIEQEMQNNIEDDNENNDNLDNFNNDNNANNMEYYQNDDYINNNDNAIDNNNLNLNINDIINERNNDAQTIKSVHSNDLYNDGHIPYEERIKTNSRKITNKFSQITRNNNINANNIINQNNNNYYNNLGKNNNQIILNTDSELKSNKNKNKPNNNYINSNLTETNNQNYQENNLNINRDINKEINNNYEKKKVPSKNKSNRYKEEKKIVNKKRNINKTMDEGLNKELSSDFSIDNITINSKITEKLKPTLEKFENYISFNNFNNFGKSQNVYSNNSLNAKKEIFGENMSNNKLLVEKTIKNDNKKEDNKI